MISYWLGVALLTVIALGIIAVPLLRKSNRQAEDALTNTQIIKQRMQELEREVAEGLIAPADKEIASNELKLALVDESQQPSSQAYSSKWLLSAGLAFTVTITALVYYRHNEVADIAHWQAVTAKSSQLAQRIVVDADPSVTRDDLEDFALAMRTRLIKSPDDHIGWLLLGRLYMSGNRLDSALQAFEKAYQLAPDHAGILASYSQALVMTGQDDYLRQAVRLAQRAINKNPQDLNAVSMLAVIYTQLGDNQKAINHLRILQQQLPAQDPLQAELTQRIAGLGGMVPQASGSAVTVTVSIDDNLRAKLPANGVLFVFAQDASGDVKMPAAVVKQPLADLPVSVELSDRNAMLPTYTLSQLRDVRLVARVSLDDNVAQASGELQGETQITLEQGTQTAQQIKIDKELR